MANSDDQDALTPEATETEPLVPRPPGRRNASASRPDSQSSTRQDPSEERAPRQVGRFIPLKVLFMAAVLLALPWLIYQAWAFVAPGLYSHEKRFALPLIFFGSVLAYSGIAFVQFFVLDRMFGFIQQFTPQTVAATPDIASYVESLLGLYLAFGIAFQVPIVVILLVRVGLVSVEKLKAFRSYFIVLSFVIAAVITPPDVVSQLALAVPMCLLYEIGIWASVIFLKKGKAPEEETTSP